MRNGAEVVIRRTRRKNNHVGKNVYLYWTWFGLHQYKPYRNAKRFDRIFGSMEKYEGVFSCSIQFSIDRTWPEGNAINFTIGQKLIYTPWVLVFILNGITQEHVVIHVVIQCYLLLTLFYQYRGAKLTITFCCFYKGLQRSKQHGMWAFRPISTRIRRYASPVLSRVGKKNGRIWRL